MSFNQVRIARATSDISKILEFYVEGLGLDVLCSFSDHDGFDGVMIGRRGDPFHFEFTLEHGVIPPRAPTKENIVVLYFQSTDDFVEANRRIVARGYSPVKSHNPYWDQNGKTYEDFEGYRVVLYKGSFVY